MKGMVILAVAGALLLGGCRSSVENGPEGVWSVADLHSLRGKTRDEVRERLGRPTGLYTIDSKGRWHYPHVQVLEEGSREPKRMTVMVYFSKFGEHRATIIEIREKF
jgi:outer membrane protein assembly factor BamE (lipoprotein component of BamABCDE complex)